MKKAIHSRFYFLLSAIMAFILSACATNKSITTPESSSSFSSDYSAWTTIPWSDSSIRIIGRADYSDSTQVFTSWSGTSYILGFSGTAVKIHLSAKGNVFNIAIDGDTAKTTTLDLTSSSDTLFNVASGLPEGKHYITVYKRTEATMGSAVFKGFDILGKANSSALPAKASKKIEFIGNSITCGYGILASDQYQNFSVLTEDASKSYASIAADFLGAEAHLISISGKGYYRNVDKTTTGILPESYDKTTLDGKSSWNFSTWIPDAVVINLGTNDFASGLPDSAQFTNSAISLVKVIRTHYPQAQIVLIDGPMLSNEYPHASAADSSLYPLSNASLAPDYVNSNGALKSQTVCQRFLNAVQGHFASNGDHNIYRVSFAAQGSVGYGADWHPSRAQAQKDGKTLVDYFKSKLGW